MVKLIVNRDTKVVKLDCIEGAEVIVYTSIIGKDIEDMQKEGLFDNAAKKPLKPLTYLIKEWNLEGDDGKPLPITTENIGKLDFKDLLKIYKDAGFSGDTPSFLEQKK